MYTTAMGNELSSCCSCKICTKEQNEYISPLGEKFSTVARVNERDECVADCTQDKSSRKPLLGRTHRFSASSLSPWSSFRLLDVWTPSYSGFFFFDSLFLFEEYGRNEFYTSLRRFISEMRGHHSIAVNLHAFLSILTGFFPLRLLRFR